MTSARSNQPRLWPELRNWMRRAFAIVWSISFAIEGAHISWIGRNTRHLILQVELFASRLGEHIEGWRKASLFAPLVFASLAGGKFRRLVDRRPADPPVHRLGESIAIFYINLDHRRDRRLEIIDEFASLGIYELTRIPAHRDKNGALGCARSHLWLADMLVAEAANPVLICEDDVEFLLNRVELDEIIDDFLTRPSLEVLCLANRVRGPRLPVSKHLAVSNNVQMAACYLVKPSALTQLAESFRRSVEELEAGSSLALSSIDQTWKSLQSGAVWFAIPKRKAARQRMSFSDITRTHKFYR